MHTKKSLLFKEEKSSCSKLNHWTKTPQNNNSHPMGIYPHCKYYNLNIKKIIIQPAFCFFSHVLPTHNCVMSCIQSKVCADHLQHRRAVPGTAAPLQCACLFCWGLEGLWCSMGQSTGTHVCDPQPGPCTMTSISNTRNASPPKLLYHWPPLPPLIVNF